MTTTTDPRLAILSALNTPPYDDAAGVYATPLGEAARLLDAYRAAVVTEVVEALQEKAVELSDLAEEQMRPSLEERAQEWYSAAELAGKLKQAKPEMMAISEIPHLALRVSPEMLTLAPHPQGADLRPGAIAEGPADSQPGPGTGRAVQGGRSPARSAAGGALDGSARPAHSTIGRPRPLVDRATVWGTKSGPGDFQESPSETPEG